MSFSKASVSLISALSFISLSAISFSLLCADRADAQPQHSASKTNSPSKSSAKSIQSHDALVVTGFQLVRAGRYKEAAEAFDGAVKLSPKNWQDLFYRGRTYSLLGESEKGLSDLSQSIKLNPDNPIAVFERGKLYYDGPKNYKLALVDLNNAIKLFPNDASAHEYRALVLNAMGKHAEAIAEFTNALALVAVNPPLSREAYLQKHFGEVNVEQAEKIKARIYFQRGKAKNDCKQYPPAISDLDYSIRLDSSTYPVFLERGKTYTKLKNKDKAVVDLERATQMARTPEVYKIASRLYTELGERQKALDAWNKAEPPQTPPATPAGSTPSMTPGPAEPGKTPQIEPTTPSATTTPVTPTTPQTIPAATPEK